MAFPQVSALHGARQLQRAFSTLMHTGAFKTMAPTRDCIRFVCHTSPSRHLDAMFSELKGVVKLGHVSLERKYRRKGHICRRRHPRQCMFWPCLRF